ncbi:hypothetical protein F5H01DRAFT_339966 [Linnemannia elongata]|nr:hypothetical protein F5H01DRAFT_339966 [Linnemannia elongata]
MNGTQTLVMGVNGKQALTFFFLLLFGQARVTDDHWTERGKQVKNPPSIDMSFYSPTVRINLYRGGRLKTTTTTTSRSLCVSLVRYLFLFSFPSLYRC